MVQKISGMPSGGAAQGTDKIEISRDVATVPTTLQLQLSAIVALVTAAVVDGAPATLDTLNELAAAIADDANFAAAMTTALGLRAPLASPSLTGTPTAPTAAPGTNTTQIATTAFVDAVRALLAPLASPALTGTPTAPTAAPGTNTTQIATTAFIQSAVSALISSSPAALDTLNELATALGNDPNFATSMATALGLRAPLASPALTGTPTAPTAAPGTNTTQLATTAFVDAVRALLAPLASPALTGTPTAPTASAGTRNTQLATTDYVDRDHWRVLARGNVAIPLTGTTAETDYVLVTVPGGAMGPNGAIRITTLASAGASNANAKNIRYRFGGNAFQNFSLASTLSNEGMRTVANRNSQTAQVAAVSGPTTFGNVGAAPAVLAIDTSAPFDIRITGLLANAGDTLTLERYLIEILYGA